MGISGVKWAMSKHGKPSMTFEIVMLILNLILLFIYMRF